MGTSPWISCRDFKLNPFKVEPGTSLVVQWVNNPPSNAGDVGSIPGQGTKTRHAVGQLSPWVATTESTCHNSEKPTCHNEKHVCRNEDPGQPKKKKNNNNKVEPGIPKLQPSTCLPMTLCLHHSDSYNSSFSYQAKLRAVCVAFLIPIPTNF